MTKKKLAVLAIGGNSLIKDKNHQTIPDQFNVTRDTCVNIVRMIKAGWQVVVTHGNGPQVGFILRRSELGAKELHTVSLDSCGADTQGAIGYMIQQSLFNEFNRQGVDGQAVTVVTQVLVDKNDTAFQDPTKYIGSFMDEATAKKHEAEDGWQIKKDSNRGWRRVVASPLPKDIMCKNAIKELVNAGFTLVAVGGGGIPVTKNAKGELSGIDAVIDKDFASGLLANILEADQFIISTAVEKVSLNFGTPEEVQLDSMTISEAKKYMAEGHFAPGSMGPKIQAVISYLEAGGKEALITSPDTLKEALEGKTGTRVILD